MTVDRGRYHSEAHLRSIITEPEFRRLPDGLG
jgi:hypothetical protein